MPTFLRRLLGASLVLCAIVPLTAGAAFVDSDGIDSPAPIRLGMSTALTGPASRLGIEMRRGVLAGLERSNRNGGAHGRRIELIALDDGYEPDRTTPNMRRLLEQEQVLAVIGNVGTPTAVVAVPLAIEQKTLFFAPFSGSGVLRKTPPDRYVVNYRASYAEETGAMIDALIREAGLKPEEIAFFTQRDAYGDAGYVGGIAALKRLGLSQEHAVVHARYERNTVAIDGALAEILLSDPPPRAVVMVGSYAPCAAFIRKAIDAELNALFVNVSFVGAEALAQQLDGDTPGVVVTQVVPHPMSSDLPLVREYREDLSAFDSSATPSFGSLEGYVAARILTLALDRVGPAPTREQTVDALEALGEFDIGLGQTLKLDREHHQASHGVWPTILRGGAFVPCAWSELHPSTASPVKGTR